MVPRIGLALPYVNRYLIGYVSMNQRSGIIIDDRLKGRNIQCEVVHLIILLLKFYVKLWH
jgi:hypothetical protein